MLKACCHLLHASAVLTSNSFRAWSWTTICWGCTPFHHLDNVKPYETLLNINTSTEVINSDKHFSNWPLIVIIITDHSPLMSTLQLVSIHLVICMPKPMSFQFSYTDILWETVKSTAKVQMGDIHCSFLIHKASHITAENNWVGHARFAFFKSMLAVSKCLFVLHVPGNVFHENLFLNLPGNWDLSWLFCGFLDPPFLKVSVAMHYDLSEVVRRSLHTGPLWSHGFECGWSP